MHDYFNNLCLKVQKDLYINGWLFMCIYTNELLFMGVYIYSNGWLFMCIYSNGWLYIVMGDYF